MIGAIATLFVCFLVSFFLLAAVMGRKRKASETSKPSSEMDSQEIIYNQNIKSTEHRDHSSLTSGSEMETFWRRFIGNCSCCLQV
jgi:hypothetical protein